MIGRRHKNDRVRIFAKGYRGCNCAGRRCVATDRLKDDLRVVRTDRTQLFGDHETMPDTGDHYVGAK